jgi:hypothetical protein
MFALLRNFTTAGFGGSRVFQVLQWDESEDNQVCLHRICFVPSAWRPEGTCFVN